MTRPDDLDDFGLGLCLSRDCGLTPFFCSPAAPASHMFLSEQSESPQSRLLVLSLLFPSTVAKIWGFAHLLPSSFPRLQMQKNVLPTVTTALSRTLINSWISLPLSVEAVKARRTDGRTDGGRGKMLLPSKLAVAVFVTSSSFPPLCRSGNSG